MGEIIHWIWTVFLYLLAGVFLFGGVGFAIIHAVKSKLGDE